MTARPLFLYTFLIAVLVTGCRPDEVKNPAFSARFIKLFGGPAGQRAMECRQLADGGYALIGTIEAGIDRPQQALLIVTSPEGNERWSRTIGEGALTRGMSMELEANGDILIACQQTKLVGNRNQTSLLMQVYSVDGVLLSSRDVRPAGSELNYAVQRVRRAPDGGLCFAGTTNDSTGSKLDNSTIRDTAEFLFFKTTAQGVVTHTFARGYTGVDIAMTANQTTEGIILMAGSSRFKLVSNQFTEDMLFLRGELSFDGRMDHNAALNNNSIPVNPDTQIVINDAVDMSVRSLSENMLAGNASGGRIYLSRINAAGITFNTAFQILPIPGTCRVRSIMPTPDGGYILAGSGVNTGQGNGGDNMLLIKTDAQGSLVWFRAFGGDRDDEGNMAIPTSDGGYLLAGTLGFEGIPMMCLIKTDPNGFID
jgi:hypothetical protein